MTTLPTVPLHGEIAAVLFGSAVQTGCLQSVVIAIAVTSRGQGKLWNKMARPLMVADSPYEDNEQESQGSGQV